MRSSHSLDRLGTAFDGTQLVADAGLLLPATLAARLGVRELVEEHLDLGKTAGRANPGDKVLTLIASALVGGDCIDDAAVLRAGGTAKVLGFRAKAPSTLGTFLRSFRWAHNLARWIARIGLGAGIVTAKTLRRRFLSMPGWLTRSARCFTLHLPADWPWAAEFMTARARIRALPLLA